MAVGGPLVVDSRLLKAYENALANINASERELIDPDSADAGAGAA